jgi:hydroxyacylglutathione hydrolase
LLLRQIFDPKLAQYAYLIGCQRTGEAVIIDPERDVDRYVAIAAEEDLRITAATETHIHADFLSGTRELAEKHGVRLFLSDEGDADWKYGWLTKGDYDATLLRHGDSFEVGHIEIKALHTPGHTPEHLSFLVIDHGGGAAEPMGIASGDFVFVGDLGRPDLLESAAGVVGAREPSARRLFESLDTFLELPDFLQVWPAHGAGSACGKALGAVPMSTVGYERRFNSAIAAARSGREVFVESILEGQPEPPVYFARMKRLNRDGVPLLGDLPVPHAMSAEALAARAGEDDAVVVDTRLARRDYMRAHVRGSLYAPLDKTFPTIVGSYCDPEREILLIVEEARLEEAVRDLVRIGYDRIGGFVPPAEIEALGGLVSTPVVDFGALELLREEPDTTVLDVRGLAEFGEGHVPEALNIAHTRLVPRSGELPPDKELLVYCRTGSRAASAASLLERMGHLVRYVDDDFERWLKMAETASP